MRIWTTSDLHLDHYKGSAASWVPPADVGEYDVAVVLGDVSNPVMAGLPWVAKHYVRPNARTIYVPGNHCAYRGAGFENTFAEEQWSMAREFCAQNGIDYLDNDVLEIDGVRIVGATGWPEFAPELVPLGMTLNDAKSLSQKGWFGDGGFGQRSPHNDFREIRVGAGNSRSRLTPSQMIAWHKETRAFFERTLYESSDCEATVVLTHVGPATGIVAGDHAWLYGSRAIEDLIVGAGVPLWLHGHTHRNADRILGGVTRTVCNPRGYPSENPHFDPGLIVEIETLDLTPTMGCNR